MVPSSPSSATTRSIPQLIDAVRTAMDSFAVAAASSEARCAFLSARRGLAEAVLTLPKREKSSPTTTQILSLVSDLAAGGFMDAPAEAQDLAWLAGIGTGSWQALIAGMLLSSAASLPSAAPFASVPDWMWAAYSRWIFAEPKGFLSPGQATTHARHLLRREEELLAWVRRNKGSKAVQDAVLAYIAISSGIAMYFNDDNQRRHAQIRAELQSLAFRLPGGRDDWTPLPREGRRLKIGFINRHFTPQTETYTTVPSFEALDPSRFEVVAFALAENGSTVESHVRSHVSEFIILPSDRPAQLEAVRSAGLDIAVFGSNLTAIAHEVGCVAINRVAPLQVVNNSSCVTTGMPEMDLYVSGSLVETAESASHYTERLGLLPGPAHAFNYSADRVDPTSTWNRAALQIPEDAVVFVSAANYFKILPEMQQAWARLLASVPHSYLLIHPFNQNWSTQYPVGRFCAGFDAVLREHGVADNRLVVSTIALPSRSDVKGLLALGDVYLDTFPFAGVNSLVDPLENGTPIVSWEGASFRSRMGAGLLRSLGLGDLVATTEAQYLELAVRLATDRPFRSSVSERVSRSMRGRPLFFDSLAASDAFGFLMEAAYDELVLNGRDAFRSAQTPLVAAPIEAVRESLEAVDLSLALEQWDVVAGYARRVLAADPANPEGRVLLARALQAQGDATRAEEYFQAVLATHPVDSLHWFEYAQFLERAGRIPAALQALERSLRLDGRRIEALQMLSALAARAGMSDLAAQADAAARAVVPEEAIA